LIGYNSKSGLLTTRRCPLQATAELRRAADIGRDAEIEGFRHPRSPRCFGLRRAQGGPRDGALTAAGSAYAVPFEAAEAQRTNVPVDDLYDRLGATAFASSVRRGSSAQIRARAPVTALGEVGGILAAVEAEQESG
jgi:hypothetical protein